MRPVNAPRTTPSCWALLTVLVLGSPAYGQGDARPEPPPAPLEPSAIGYLRVEQPDVEVLLPRRDFRVEPVAKLPLIRETEDYYCVVWVDKSVCAFPKFDDHGEPSGWVGESGIVFLTRPVSPERFKLRLTQRMELPVLRMGKRNYYVRIGHALAKGNLFVPKETDGVSFHHHSRLEQYEARYGPPEPPEPPEPPPSPGRPATETGRVHRVVIRPPRQTPEPPATEPTPATSTVAVASPEPDEPPVPPAPILEKLPSRVARGGVKYGGRKLLEQSRRGCLALASTHVVRLLIALLVVCVALLVLVRFTGRTKRVSLRERIRAFRAGQQQQQRRRQDARKKKEAAATARTAPKAEKPEKRAEKSEEGEKTELFAVKDAKPLEEVKVLDEHEISGSLELVSIMDIVQFLNSTHKEGTLFVGDSADPLAKAVFVGGEIVSARCGMFEGEDAVFAMLRQKKGPFQFFKGKLMMEGPKITKRTVSLLMEGVKRLDEAEKKARSSPRLKDRLRAVLRKGLGDT
ncbi:MAG: DUF4388 domain-containing protein [Kiritimatiellae bacterium]|nr:DUF4388 domain-containing protein [Kiritimatiellia bacterium]